jgi:hypothetical protein
MEQQELSILKNFEKDSKWFHENINKLRKEGFTGKFVAIKGAKPLTSGKNIDIVISKIEEKGENPSYIFIEFVHPEGFTLIL